MKFDLMGIVFMAVAIFGGNYVGSMLAGYLGGTGGLLGTFIVGLAVYAVYSLLTGQKLAILSGVIFALCVYISGIIVSVVSTNIGIGGGIVGVLINAVVLSFLWGWAKGKGSPVASVTTTKSKKRKR